MNETIRVLLVDDDEDAYVIMRDLLDEVRHTRYLVDWASTFEQARQTMERDEHDLYLLDYRLGQHTGLDLLRLMQSRASDKPAILLTGQGDDEVDLEAMKAGVADYWCKDQLNAVLLERSIRYAIERKRADRLERERNNLRESGRVMDQVLGVVGHELRTPLAGLRAMSEYLLTDGQPDAPEFGQFLHGINAEVIRLAEMVDHMLEAARLDSGVAHWRWSRISIARVCQEALQIIQPLVDTDQVTLLAQSTPPDLSIMGDEDAIRRLVLNLVTNAHKHTSRGQIRVRAHALALADGPWVEIEVQDSGSGIPPQIADRLGRAFMLNASSVGADGGRLSKGLGLGLAICRGIVAAHGGSIRVRSKLNAGTTFTVRLKGDLPAPDVSGQEVQIEKEIDGEHGIGR